MEPMRTLPALSPDAVVLDDEAVRVPPRSIAELLPPDLDLARIAHRERTVLRAVPALLAVIGAVALMLTGH